jgi:hypothetical protein
MQWTDLIRIRSVHHMPPIPPHPYQAHIPQDLQVFRNRRLLQPRPHDQIADRKLSDS